MLNKELLNALNEQMNHEFLQHMLIWQWLHTVIRVL